MRSDSQKKEATENSDSLLIGQAFIGSQEAFERLVQRYQSPLQQFAHKYLKDDEQVNDVLQFVFFQLFRSLPTLHAHLSSTRTKTPLKSWLFQVAKHRCLDELRKHHPISFEELEASDREELLLDGIPDPSPLPEELAEQHDVQRLLAEAIIALPEKYRPIVALRYTKDLTFGEIGHRLHIPENTAKTYFKRARTLLRIALNDERPSLPLLEGA